MSYYNEPCGGSGYYKVENKPYCSYEYTSNCVYPYRNRKVEIVYYCWSGYNDHRHQVIGCCNE